MARETPSKEGTELESLPYEQIVEELESVVKQLEAGDLPLEESLRAFERGVLLSRAAEGRLDAAEHRVEVLLHGDRVASLPGHDIPEMSGEGATPEDDDVPF